MKTKAGELQEKPLIVLLCEDYLKKQKQKAQYILSLNKEGKTYKKKRY